MTLQPAVFTHAFLTAGEAKDFLISFLFSFPESNTRDVDILMLESVGNVFVFPVGMEDSEQKILWVFCCCCKHTVLIMLIKCKSMQKKHKLCSSVTDVFLLRTWELVCFIPVARQERKTEP